VPKAQRDVGNSQPIENIELTRMNSWAKKFRPTILEHLEKNCLETLLKRKFGFGAVAIILTSITFFHSATLKYGVIIKAYVRSLMRNCQ